MEENVKCPKCTSTDLERRAEHCAHNAAMRCRGCNTTSRCTTEQWATLRDPAYEKTGCSRLCGCIARAPAGKPPFPFKWTPHTPKSWGRSTPPDGPPTSAPPKSPVEIELDRAADHAFRFLAGLSLDHHSRADQIEALDVLRALKVALLASDPRRGGRDHP